MTAGTPAAETRLVPIGLVGAGRWGTNYLHTLADVPGCQLVGIADSDPARTRTLARNRPEPVFNRLEPLLELASAVIVATPDPTHAAVAREALLGGCDVLVEKPMALRTEEAFELEALARSTGRVLAVGQTSLYHHGFLEARAAVRQRTAGRSLNVRSIRTSRGIPGSDLLWDLAPHSVAVALCLFGDPRSATAERNGSADSHPGGESAVLRMEFPDVKYEARLAWSSGPPERRLTIEGSEGTFEFDETRLGADHPLPLTLLCRDFVNACWTRRQPLADARLGARVVACIEVLQESVQDRTRMAAGLVSQRTGRSVALR